VNIGASDSGGGILGVYNSLGKLVATVQSNKMNCGLVAVGDANGETKNGFSGNP